MEEVKMTTQLPLKRNTLKIKKRVLMDTLEQLPGRVEMLNERDRAFVNLLLTSQKFRTIARAAGVHEATVARRLKKIAARITGDNFINALSQRNITPAKMQILRDYFVDGLSMFKIAAKHKNSYHKIRKFIRQYQPAVANTDSE
jgi:DNA-binding Lrp family transcriptional regulator